VIYFDTSYLLRCYYDDPGYEAVRRLADQDQLACCGQGRVELAAALHRKMREGALTASAVTLLLRQVQHDKCAKGGGKRIDAEGMPGAGLTEVSFRKALSGMLALKPYWGKPAVRNFTGDDGNVGIIRSPVRAIVLLDRWISESFYSRT